ncbi:MAG: hypothetical protein QOF21_11, partial [Actinomycetota bacterium]
MRLVRGTAAVGPSPHLKYEKEPHMSGTRRAVAAAGIVAVVVAALIGWAVTASGANKNTFAVDGQITAFTPIDLGPAGDSPGDQGVIAGTLTQDGANAGAYQGHCVNITDPSHSECTFSFFLDDGQIVVTT